MRKLAALLLSSSGLTLAVAASAGLTLQGCSSDDDAGGGAKPLGEATGRTSATLNDNAFALKTEAVAVDATSVTLPANAETNSIEVGDMIMSGNGQLTNTFLRRVTAVAPGGGTIVFTTTNATFPEFFKEIDLDQHADFTEGRADSAAVDEVAEDGTSLAPQTFGLEPQTFGLAPQPEFGLSPLELTALPGGGKSFSLAEGRRGYVVLEGGGRLDMQESYFRVSGGVDFAYAARGALNPLPEHFRLVLNGGVAIHVGGRLTAEGAVHYRTPKLEYVPGQGLFVGRLLFYAGPVPIPIAMYLKLNGQAQVGLGGESELHAGVTFTTSMQGGFDYRRGSGFQGVASLRKTVHIEPLSGHNAGTVNVTVYPIQAELRFNILNIPDTGPFISVNPYVQARASTPEGAGRNGTLVNASRNLNATAALGAQFRVGGEVEIFGHELGEVEATLLDYHHDIPICPPSQLTCRTVTEH